MNIFNDSNYITLKRLALCTGLVFSLLAAVSAQNAAAPSAQEVISKVDEYMALAERIDRFNGAILVARDGKPLVSRGYGMANVEWDIPNSPKTAFRLGSVTKPFTSVAIMILQERGKLSISDPACKYISDCPAAWEPITIRHLLTHTSGIPNYTAFPGFLEKRAMMPLGANELLADYKSKPLDFAPGERNSYSNSGYHLLGVIIEKASGKSYAEFLQENIFGPLGMKQTGYDTHRDVIKWRAAGYRREGDGFVHAPYMDMLIPYSAGALYSTVGDLLIFDQALLTDKLLTQKSRDEMFTPFKGNYALGWGVGKRFERASTSHGGAINGFASQFIRFPDDKVTIVVLSNVQGSGVDKVANALGAIVFGAKYELPRERKAITVASTTLQKYVGDYQLTSSIVAAITFDDGKLWFKIDGQPKLELFPETETDFFMKAVDAQVTFVKDESGKVVRMQFKQGSGSGIPAAKIK
ncbi:MAG: serine hydrolase [Chloracidobacterium sp.]|nr:serine hydrolase [Chloracidobacterium sp.]